MSTVEQQLNRICEVVGCSSYCKLAEILNVKQSVITDAIRRKEIPKNWLERLSAEWGANPEWILAGDVETKHPIKEGPISGTHEIVQNKALCAVAEEKTCEHCHINKLMRL